MYGTSTYYEGLIHIRCAQAYTHISLHRPVFFDAIVVPLGTIEIYKNKLRRGDIYFDVTFITMKATSVRDRI